MATVYAIANGNWSSGSIWNTNTVPTTADDVFSNNFTVQVDGTFTVLSVRNTAAAPIVAGGSFVLSTPNTTLSVNSLVAGATNLIIATAVSGTNTLNSTNGIQGLSSTNSTIINHTGAGNLTIITPSVVGGGPVTNLNGSIGITKSGLGTLTIGNSTNLTLIRAGAGVNLGNGTANHAISSNNGNIVIVGTVQGPVGSGTSTHAILQTVAGNLTITGNVIGGTVVGHAINSSSTGLLDITGNVTGGSGLAAINKSVGAINITGNVSGSNTSAIVGITGVLTVTGNVTGNVASGITGTPISASVIGDVLGSTAAAIAVTNTAPISITGKVTASSVANAVSALGVVSVEGLIENTSQVQAVYSPRILIGLSTTSIRYQTSLGATQLMYLGTSGVSGQPTTNNVRFGTPFGVDGVFVGTCRIPTPNTVLLGAPTDNTTGTLLMTPDEFVEELDSSTTAVAVRLRNVSTVATTGDQIASYNI